MGSDTEFFLTSARQNLGYLSDLAVGYDVAIEDVSDDYGVLAVQGPRSRAALSALAPEVNVWLLIALMFAVAMVGRDAKDKKVKIPHVVEDDVQLRPLRQFCLFWRAVLS